MYSCLFPGPNCTVGVAHSCNNHERCVSPTNNTKQGRCECTEGYERVYGQCVLPDAGPEIPCKREIICKLGPVWNKRSCNDHLSIMGRFLCIKTIDSHAKCSVIASTCLQGIVFFLISLRVVSGIQWESYSLFRILTGQLLI